VDLIPRHMREKIDHFRLGHFARMPFLVVQNEPANPIRISLLGANTEMFAAITSRT
jgi:hypothetical protein